MKKWIVLMTMIVSVTAFAGSDRDRGGRGGKKDGHGTCCGDVPVPFSANQKVELANGEYYQLVGKVIFFQALPFLNVDLDVHPWLAASNTKYGVEKIYPLQGSPAYWKTYESKRVKMNVQAAADLVDACSNSPLYIISLDLIGQPEIVPSNR